MARTAHDTRDKLITTGQHLFAEQGVFSVPLRLVVEQAGQKNSSALHYHFGGRNGLLSAIIDRHNAGIEAERCAMLDAIRAADRQRDVPALVEAFIVPFARTLATEEGREFLRVVAQLSGVFDLWADGGPSVASGALETLSLLSECVPVASPEIRRERCTTLLMLVAASLALRARQIDQGRALQISDDEFVANLIAMSVGAMCADWSPQ